jgi:hypothetical protein
MGSLGRGVAELEALAGLLGACAKFGSPLRRRTLGVFRMRNLLDAPLGRVSRVKLPE